MSTKSKCRTCGEKILESGNYQVKLLKAAPIPNKVRKLIKAGKLDEHKKQALEQTKFGRFLLKRANQANIVEIICCKCSSSCQIRAVKAPKTPLVINACDTPPTTATTTPPTSLSKSAKKRRKKQHKEINAGLLIPPSCTPPTPTSTPTYEFKSDTPTHNVPVPPKSKPPPVGVDKKKEMDNLRKVLFKSKKKSKDPATTTTTLKDFLSSM